MLLNELMDWTLQYDETVSPTTHLAALWEMSRPSQLGIMVSLYGLGVAAGHTASTPLPLDALLTGTILLVIAGASINFVNEYADYESDLRAERTAFSGGSGALIDNGLPKELGLHAAIAALAVCVGLTVLAVVIGIASLAVGSLIALFLLLGWQYSVWPAALAWRGFGELDNAVAGGLVIPIYGYAVINGSASLDLVAAFVPTTAFLFLTLLATTWPDRQNDARAGKATLATQLERVHLRTLYLVWLGLAVVLIALLPPATLPNPVRAGAALSLYGFIFGFLKYTRWHSPTPTVLAMVAGVCLQAVGWLLV